VEVSRIAIGGYLIKDRTGLPWDRLPAPREYLRFARNAPLQTRHRAERRGRQGRQGQKPQASHRHRPVESA
jgi:hypothetical protein